ncbi:MAG: AAA domain-containing protein, partial [bacterium]|nr:AAA domain-containing protein [bacterium]
MPWPDEARKKLLRLKNVERILKSLFSDRDLAIDLVTLAALTQEHLLILGPPGTAKTELLSRFTDLIDARGFHYLLTRFTEPTEIFGPLDLDKFKQGTFHIVTEGMLPEAQVAFLDEVFQGSSAILNSLLTLLNERVFHNGAQRQEVPLLTLVGASNHLPEDPWLRAFADRFALRLELDPVAEQHLDGLLDAGWHLETARIEAAARKDDAVREMPELKVEDLTSLHGRLLEVSLDGVRPLYANVIREIRAEGIELSDRRVVKGLKLVAGAALLRESDVAEARDLWPLNHVWSRPGEAEVLRGVVQPRVDEAGGPSLDVARGTDEIVL